MVKWIVVMQIQLSICLDDWGKPRKNPSQVGRHRDLNPGHPECESRALPRSHLARSLSNCYAFCRVTVHFCLLYSFVNRINGDPLFFIKWWRDIYWFFHHFKSRIIARPSSEEKFIVFFFCRCSISLFFYLLSTFRCCFSSFFYYRGCIPFSGSV